MSLFVYVCMYVFLNVHQRARLLVCMCACMYVCMYASCVCNCKFIFIRLWFVGWIDLLVFVRFVFLLLNVSMHIRTDTDTHTP